ncbi:MAG: hypothetical protein EOO53_13290 [Gammaproteobacteria bacterium]|nr:MAG: hypothetical protein EOO53_13290 [Gammaproteobacteria bacterium]
MTKYIVDANYRFMAAYQEVNTRISQRQQALSLYATLVLSLLAALVALKPSSGGGVPVEWLLPGFPAASLCLAFLNYKGERAITNLRRFLAALEQLNNAHEELPSYNTHPKWSEGANKARRFHDLTAFLLVTAGNGIGLGAAIHIYPDRVAAAPFAIWGSVVVAIISMVILLLIPRWSYSPDTVKVQKNDPII